MTHRHAETVHHVFAYGSNMHLGDLTRWLHERGYGQHRLRPGRPARLVRHRLVWNYHSPPRRGGAANIEPCPDRDLLGVVLEVDPFLLRAIDHKEGHPERYHRGETPRPVELLDGERAEAWVYVVRPPHRRPSPVLPQRAYLDLMVEGARQHGLPASWVEELAAMPVVG